MRGFFIASEKRSVLFVKQAQYNHILQEKLLQGDGEAFSRFSMVRAQ